MLPLIPVIALGVASALGIRHYRNVQKSRGIFTGQVKNWLKAYRMPEDCSVNACLPDGNPLIVRAVAKNVDTIVAELIKYGADVNAMNPEGKTALFYASSREMAKMLVDAGAVVNARDTQGRTPIFYVKNPELLIDLINWGADIDVLDKNGWNVLCSFASADEHSPDIRTCVKILLNNNPHLVDILDDSRIIQYSGKIRRIVARVQQDRAAEFFNAIKANNLLLAGCMLDEGVDPNVTAGGYFDCGDSCCLLDWAIINKKFDVAELLLGHGAKPEELSVWYALCAVKTLKDINERDRCLLCIRSLLEAGALIREGDYREVVYSDDKELISIFASHILKVKANGKWEKKVLALSMNAELIQAVLDNDLEKIHFALNHGANPNCEIRFTKEDKGKLILVYAIEMNQPELIKLLVIFGADVNMLTGCGVYENVLSVAIKQADSNPEKMGCLKILLEAGAKPNEINLKEAMDASNRDIFMLVRSV